MRDRWLNPEGATREGAEEADPHEPLQRTSDLAHKKLDEAVFDAYGWPHDIGEEEILEQLLALNLKRAVEQENK